MKRHIEHWSTLLGVLALGALASGCATQDYKAAKLAKQESDKFDDFGQALRQDIAAQIADPDAVYNALPPPTDGKRMDYAQRKYQGDAVKTATLRTTNVGAQISSDSDGSAAPSANESATASPNP